MIGIAQSISVFFSLAGEPASASLSALFLFCTAGCPEMLLLIACPQVPRETEKSWRVELLLRSSHPAITDTWCLVFSWSPWLETMRCRLALHCYVFLGRGTRGLIEGRMEADSEGEAHTDWKP